MFIKIYCLIIVYLVCVMCKIYLVSSIAILLVVIVSNIGNEQNIILINVRTNILLFLDVY